MGSVSGRPEWQRMSTHQLSGFLEGSGNLLGCSSEGGGGLNLIANEFPVLREIGQPGLRIVLKDISYIFLEIRHILGLRADKVRADNLMRDILMRFDISVDVIRGEGHNESWISNYKY
jgi:hypothetical protein